MLQVKKRPISQILALYVFFIPIFLNFFQDYLHIPSLIKYTVDAALVASLFLIIITKEYRIQKNTLPFILFIAIYFLYVFISYLFLFQSPIYFLWGVRNNFRYFIAFITFIYFIDSQDMKLCLKALDIIFAFHTLVCFLQFFAFGYKGDYLGGIFGNEQGCNGHSLIFISIVCIKSVILFMNNQEKIWLCLLKNCAALVVAIMSELKVFFLILPLIFLVASLITKISPKKIFIVAGALTVIVLSINLFTIIWGSEHKLTASYFLELITSENYSSSTDIGRFTAIPIITKYFLKGVTKKLFGLGLGNCDTSSFAICNTPFYEKYSSINYSWFSSAFILLETGFLGLAFTFGFFILVIVMALKLKKKKPEISSYCQIAVISCILCMIMVFYNSALRSDIGYLPYFILSVPFCLSGKNKVVKYLF